MTMPTARPESRTSRALPQETSALPVEILAAPSFQNPGVLLKGSPRRPGRSRIVSGLALTAVLALSSCASLSVKRDTSTSGTFNSSGRSFTFLSWDMPRPAIQIAQENAADAGLPNMHTTSVSATDWGWFDWILEIISVRSARVKGTWGFTGE